jgi:hypothetical protein
MLYIIYKYTIIYDTNPSSQALTTYPEPALICIEMLLMSCFLLLFLNLTISQVEMERMEEAKKLYHNSCITIYDRFATRIF